jgi:GMP synthase-like glutamine amidotransferase
MLRCAYFNCEDLPKWSGSFEQFILPSFAASDQSEEWTHVRLADASFTELPDPSAFDAVVISGSHYCVRDEPAFQSRLCAWLSAAAARSAPRVVGICYGAQVIAHALGGRVERNPAGRFVLGAERVNPSPALAELPCAVGLLRCAGGAAGGCGERDASGVLVRDWPDAAEADLDVDLRTVSAGGAVCPLAVAGTASSTVAGAGATTVPPPTSQVWASPPAGPWAAPPPPPALSLCSASDAPWARTPLSLLESHGDHVADLPPGATLLASSESACNEIFLCAGSIIGVQGHPELSARALLSRIWPAVVVANKRLSEAEAADALDSLARPRHAGLVLEILRRFLRAEK